MLVYSVLDGRGPVPHGAEVPVHAPHHRLAPVAGFRTLAGGQRGSEFTVAKELGHGGGAMGGRGYGPLGPVGHRAAAGEDRVNQHAAILRDRLTALRARSSVCDSVSERPGRQTAKSLQGNTRQ